jgi:hypothetical protein
MEIIKSEKFKTEIKIGQNWIVESNHFMAYSNLNKRKEELICNGTEFKIIHPEEWHFLTESGKVFFAKPHDILEHCKCLEDSKIDIKKILNTPKKVIEVRGRYKNKLTKIKLNEDI